MSAEFLVQLPAHLEKAYRLGQIVITGGVARYADSGQIVAHLEPAIRHSLGFAGGINPQFAMARSAFETARVAKGMVVDTAKLNKIMQLTQSVQTLSAVNLAVGSVTLGVAVIGFAVVLHKLHRIDNRLQGIETQLQSIDRKTDSLVKNEVIKLVRKAKLALKHSITLVHQLEENGWNLYLDTEIAQHLDSMEVLLEEVINRCSIYMNINVPSEIAQCLYSSYANLLKAYLTARYSKKKELGYAAQRIQTLENFNDALTSPDFLDELYESYLFDQAHRLSESELDYIFTLYRYGCKNTQQAVNSHHEILMTTHPRKFRRWKNLVNKCEQPAIWIEHAV